MFIESPLAVGEAQPKINLTLRLRAAGPRSDGLHEIASLAAPVAGPADRIVLAARPKKKAKRKRRERAPGPREKDPQHAPEHELPLTVLGPFADRLAHTPTEQNSVVRAVRAFQRERPRAVLPDLALVLEKNLPVGAGFGGGSADAAECLRLLATLAHGGGTPDPAFGPAASASDGGFSLGADVPLMLAATPAWITGAGERILPIARLPYAAVVLAQPRRQLETAEVYRAFDEQNQARDPRAADGQAANPPETGAQTVRPPEFQTLDQLVEWCALQGNDLAESAVRLEPEAGTLRERLRNSKGCLYAEISGSGSGCFGLFANRRDAQKAARRLGDLWASVGEIGAGGE